MTEETEFERVCNGQKPMAAYYKRSSGPWYHENRRYFEYEVCSGNLMKIRFHIKNDNQNFKMIYEAYCREENYWRMDLYKHLIKIGQTRWNADLEAIEGILLGYRGMYGVTEELKSG